MSNSTLPRLAMVLGDPAGIGPELIARLLAEPEVRRKAQVVLIADEAEVRRGMDIAGQSFPYRIIESTDALQFADDTPLLLPFRGRAEGDFPRSEACLLYTSDAADE